MIAEICFYIIPQKEKKTVWGINSWSMMLVNVEVDGRYLETHYITFFVWNIPK